MDNVKTILWDVDGTLLDFLAAEEMCILKSLAFQGESATKEELSVYSDINKKYWEMLERGEVTKERLYPGRFEDWFKYLGKDYLDPNRMNQDYQETLGLYPVLMKDAIYVLEALKGRYRQYVVSNGSLTAQKGKLKLSGIGELMDGIFISEEIGYPKPNIKFFEFCKEHIPDYDAQSTIIIGDSLTSDILGGNNAGIRTVWFNPSNAELKGNISVDLQISSLIEILDVLK